MDSITRSATPPGIAEGSPFRMLNSRSFRLDVATRLEAAQGLVPNLSAFVGLDGFVDEILHVVDKRHSVEKYDRLPTISSYASRLAGAAGRSTNVEMVSVMTKLGGNGPIMANALATFGLSVTYLGALGYPTRHPVFDEFAKHAEVHSVSNPGLTDALEFEDGKIMSGKHYSLRDVSWANIQARYGLEPFRRKFETSSLIAFVNWTMLPNMSDIWKAVLQEVCPRLSGPRRTLFVDLADPEKRVASDISRALELIVEFEKYFDVILGLNEKEAHEVATVLGLEHAGSAPSELSELAESIANRVPVNTLVIHPVSYAIAISQSHPEIVAGPICSQPLITTGAGDHFNSGYCLGKLLGLSSADSLLCGVATSGYYVRTAKSPRVPDIIELMRHWPTG